MWRVALVLGLATTAAGCLDGPPTCPLSARTSDGLLLRLETASGTLLPEGDYEVVFTADGETMTFNRTVTTTVGAECTRDCSIERMVGDRHLVADTLLQRGRGWARIGYEDGGGPSPVGFEVRQGAVVYASRTFTPDYEAVELSGPGCGFTIQAVETVILVAP